MYKIVIFEGPSGTGKTTLRYKVFQEYYSKYGVPILTIDRFTSSLWVYEYLRGIDITKQIQNMEIQLQLFNPILILCTCSTEIANGRVNKNNQFRKVNFETIDEQKAFEKYLAKITKYSKIVTVQTDKYSIEENTNFILSKLE